ncbi:MAG TPA: acyltransferase, partial [Chloroflexota bacterium]
ARSFWAPQGVTLPSVLLTALLLHGWTPETFNSVVPGDWSIAAEWGFYALFPALMLFRSWRSAAIAALVAALATAVAYDPAFTAMRGLYLKAPRELIRQFEVFWLPGCLYVFLGGIASSHASHALRLSSRAATFEVIAALGLIATLPLAPQLPGLPALGAAIAFTLLIHGLSQGGAPWMVNPVVARLGLVSFSVYLWHFAVITALRPFTVGWPGFHGLTYLLLYVIVLAVAYALSEATYRTVERPMTRLGRKLAEHVARRQIPPSARPEPIAEVTPSVS